MNVHLILATSLGTDKTHKCPFDFLVTYLIENWQCECVQAKLTICSSYHLNSKKNMSCVMVKYE